MHTNLPNVHFDPQDDRDILIDAPSGTPIRIHRHLFDQFVLSLVRAKIEAGKDKGEEDAESDRRANEMRGR